MSRRQSYGDHGGAGPGFGVSDGRHCSMVCLRFDLRFDNACRKNSVPRNVRATGSLSDRRFYRCIVRRPLCAFSILPWTHMGTPRGCIHGCFRGAPWHGKMVR